MSKISVIVPVYNVEEYLPRCIDSILAQTFTDFKVVLVDDGSPDNCGKICDDYAKKDSRITVIHQKNKGLSGARNTGIDWALKKSESEWIAFVDSDDRIHPKFLEYLCRAVIENNVKIAMSCFEISDDVNYSFKPVGYDVRLCDGINLFLNNGEAVSVCNKLYKKEIFDNLRFPEGKIHEDSFVSYKLLYLVGEIALVNSRLYVQFLRQGSITRSGFYFNRLHRLEALNEMLQFFKERSNEIYKKLPMYAYNIFVYNLYLIVDINQKRVFRKIKKIYIELLREYFSITDNLLRDKYLQELHKLYLNDYGTTSGRCKLIRMLWRINYKKKYKII